MLTWVAGHMDAISYLGLGHVFTAMMTGNTVLLGLALAQGEVSAAVRSVLALVGFLAGAGVGALIVERERHHVLWPSVVTGALVLEGVILALFTVTWQLTGPERSVGTVGRLILLSGGAMGIQSAAVRRLGVPGIATTYITGTLTSLMVDLVGGLRVSVEPPLSTPEADASGAPRPAVNWERRVGLLAGVFAVYCLGALAGGVLQARFSRHAAWVPLLSLALVVASAACHPEGGRRPP